MKKTAYKVALGGIVTAMCIALMFLTGLFPFGTYAFPCFAGFLLIAIVEEIGCPFAVAVYAAVSVMSFLFVSDKEAALFFVMLFGYYPIVKTLIDRMKSRPVIYVLKFLIFNVAAVAAFFIGTYLLAIPPESYVLFGFYVPWVFLLVGNIFFLIYDKCIDNLKILYLKKIQPVFNKKY